MKKEKGSITVFVLCVGLLIAVACIQLFIRNNNSISSQQEKQQIIERQYNTSNADAIYQNIVEEMETNGGE